MPAMKMFVAFTTSALLSFGTAASIFMMVSALSSCSVVYLLSAILVSPFVGAFCVSVAIICNIRTFVNGFFVIMLTKCDFVA